MVLESFLAFTEKEFNLLITYIEDKLPVLDKFFIHKPYENYLEVITIVSESPTLSNCTSSNRISDECILQARKIKRRKSQIRKKSRSSS